MTADIEVDNKTNKYSFKTDDIHLRDDLPTAATEGYFPIRQRLNLWNGYKIQYTFDCI